MASTRTSYRCGVGCTGEACSNGQATTDAATLLPVEVSTPTMLPTERAIAPKVSKPDRALSIEVEFANGRRLRIHGTLDRPLLRELIAALSSR